MVGKVERVAMESAVLQVVLQVVMAGWRAAAVMGAHAEEQMAEATGARREAARAALTAAPKAAYQEAGRADH